MGSTSMSVSRYVLLEQHAYTEQHVCPDLTQSPAGSFMNAQKVWHTHMTTQLRAGARHTRLGRQNSSHVGRMLQVAMRLRPLNAREVAQGETEAVTVSHEDPHSLEVGAAHPRMLRQQPFAFSMRSHFKGAVHKSGLPVQVAWDNIACLLEALALNSQMSRILSHSHGYYRARCEHQ